MSQQPVMKIHLDGDGAFAHFADHETYHTTTIELSALAGGMVGGAPTVAIAIELPERKVVLAETSLKLFLTAADMLRAKFGDPR